PLYKEEGTYTVTVSITETGEAGTAITVTDSQQVNEPAIVGSSALLTAVNEGDAAATVEVATFTHANGVEAAGDFAAAVDWGIAGHHADAATVSEVGTTYHVTATRSIFSEEGTYTVTVSLSEAGETVSTSVTDSQQVRDP